MENIPVANGTEINSLSFMKPVMQWWDVEVINHGDSLLRFLLLVEYVL